MFPLEFRAEVNDEETIVMGYPPVKTVYDCSFSHFATVSACVRQTDRQTDGRTTTTTVAHNVTPRRRPPAAADISFCRAETFYYDEMRIGLSQCMSMIRCIWLKGRWFDSRPER